jgi:hypothetical protein
MPIFFQTLPNYEVEKEADSLKKTMVSGGHINTAHPCHSPYVMLFKS